jgi:ParB-like chromosome segregation protein Spo0J
VLPELSQLLPPLDGEQLSVLEADILTNGCYSPVIVNEDLVIVDGHHRQKICQEHDISELYWM